MAYNKKTWLARLGQGLNKFIFNGGSKVTLDSAPDVVSQQGTPLSADNMNDLEQRIKSGFDDVDSAINAIIETGSNANGRYYKFINGLLICEHRITVTVSSWEAWGSIYRSIPSFKWTFPLAFQNYSRPRTFFSCNSAVYGVLSCGTDGDNNNTQSASIQAFKPSDAGANTEFHFSCFAIGRWKD